MLTQPEHQYAIAQIATPPRDLAYLDHFADTTPALARRSKTRLEEIIVTASKRETNLMQTPLAITAFTPGLPRSRRRAHGARSRRHGAQRATRHRRRLRHGSDDPRRHIDRLHRSRRRRGRNSPRRLLLAASARHARADVRPRARRNPARAARHAVRHELLGRHDQHHSRQAASSTTRFAKAEAAFGNYNERQARGMLNLARHREVRAAPVRFMVDRHDGMLQQGKDVTDIEYAGERYLSATAFPTSISAATHDVSTARLLQQHGSMGRAPDRSLAGDGLAGSDRARISHFSDQGAGDIDFVDCEQAAGTINACTSRAALRQHQRPGQEGSDDRRLPAQAGRAAQ